MNELVKVEQNLETVKDKKQFCTFWLSGRLFGVDIFNAKEVNTTVEFTPIFHAPKEVEGYVNIRGQIYLVIDIRQLLGFEKSEITEDSRVVIFKDDIGESFGVLVDKIGDVVEVAENEIEKMKKGRDFGGDLNARLDDLTTGVCRLKDNLLVIINPKVLLPEIERLTNKN